MGLGKWGSPEAALAYDRVIAEYVATRGVRDPQTQAEQTTVVTIDASVPGATVRRSTDSPKDAEESVSSEPTVTEVVLQYLEYCDTYYRTPTGERTSTYGNALQAARALRPFDDTPTATFGPRKLGMIRDSEAARGRCRRLVAFSAFIRGGSGTSPMTTVQITISDALAKEAAAEGLLEPGSIEAILRERLAAVRVAKMQATRQKYSATATPPMTAEEIEAEIRAYRAERRCAASA